MDPKAVKPRSAARCGFEILIAAAFAAALLTKLSFSDEIYWNAQFFGWETGLNQAFHQRYNDHLGQNLAFCAFAAPISIAGFLLLRVLSRFSSAELVLRATGGGLAAAIPSVCFWSVTWYRQPDHLWAGTWMPAEGSVAIVLALIFGLRRGLVGPGPTAGLLTCLSQLPGFAADNSF